MHAPRRVPYRSLGDLGAVHAQVYGPSSSTIGAPPTPSSSSSSSSTPSAVRCPPELALYAHHSPASTPVALSLTASLLSALALPPSLAQRLALSAALVRLVNSLVDPLQQGLYARPIALLAAELGLPGWLVELRHAATHDDLPSLAVLSDGAREALAYLDRAYWQPTLNPPQAVNSDESWAVHAAVLPALLGTYKRLAKQLARDSSTFPGPFKACVAELRTWVAAPQDDQRALGLLVDRLVAGGEGLLVPLAKKKRPVFTPATPHPSKLLLATYTPLLLAFAKSHPALFPSLLARRLASALSAPPRPSADDPSPGRSRSEDGALSAWLVWTLEALLDVNARGTAVGDMCKEAFASDELKTVVRVLAGRHPDELGRRLGGVLRVLGALGPQTDPLPPTDDSPMDTTPSSPSGSTAGVPPPLPPSLSSLALPGTTSRARPTPSSSAAAAAPLPAAAAADDDDEAGAGATARAREAGWVRVPEAEWSLRPMGVRVGE